MLKHEFDLVWGLPADGGGTAKRAALRPMTIAGELRALEAVEAQGLPENAAAAAFAETLAYWAEQLEVDGVPPEKLTGAFLMDNLTGEDYRLILAAQDDLRGKYTAAGTSRAQPAAANAPAAGATPTEPTANPSS